MAARLGGSARSSPCDDLRVIEQPAATFVAAGLHRSAARGLVLMQLTGITMNIMTSVAWRRRGPRGGRLVVVLEIIYRHRLMARSV